MGGVVVAIIVCCCGSCGVANLPILPPTIAGSETLLADVGIMPFGTIPVFNKVSFVAEPIAISDVTTPSTEVAMLDAACCF